MVTIVEEKVPWSKRMMTGTGMLHTADFLMRMAFVEYLKSIDADFGPWQTVLDATLFPAKIVDPIAREIWKRMDVRPYYLYVYTANRAEALMTQIRANLAVPDMYGPNDDALLLSLADQQLVINAINKLNDKQWTKFLEIEEDGYDNPEAWMPMIKRIARSISEPVTVEVLQDDMDITLIQGGHGDTKFTRKINKDSGKFYITRNGVDQFGLTIPIHVMPPDTKPLVNIEYPNPAKNTSIIVTGAPSGTKVTIKEGDTAMQRSLSANDLRSDIWTFSVEVEEEKDGST